MDGIKREHVRVNGGTSKPTYELKGMTLKEAGITLQPGESYIIQNPEPNVYWQSGHRFTDREIAIFKEMGDGHAGFSR